MTMARGPFSACICLLLTVAAPLATRARAQEPVDWDVVAKIREEGFQRSQVMDLVWYMTDVIGPRVTGSPNMRRGQQWAKSKMEELGLVNVVIEPYTQHGISWDNEYTSLHLLEPDYQPLIGYPYAFTSGTNGKLTGEPVIVHLRTRKDLDAYRGKLRGAIVLMSPPRPTGPRFTADASRFSATQLNRKSRSTIRSPYGVGQDDYVWDDQAMAFVKVEEETGTRRQPELAPEQIYSFFRQEGVGVLLDAAPGGDGTVFVEGRPGSRLDRSYETAVSSPPMVSLAAEHYNRIYRLVRRGIPVKLEIEVRNAVARGVGEEYNVLGDLPGTDLASELVMVGGHFDSWHAGTGAADDAAGCAVALEAVRILRAVGVPLRRTIRVAFWTHEEGGRVGSRAYIRKHYGDPRTAIAPAYDRFSVYFNMDNGTGRFRGVYLQGNERARPIFTEWMRAFADLEMETLTIDHALGVDVVAFDMVGLPAFQFIQDPLDYDTRVHHSNMDVYDRLVADDLRRNAVIIAAFLYHAAVREDRFPRKTQ